MVYFVLFLLSVVVLGVFFAPKHTGILLRYAYFLRVPILFGPLFLVLLAYFGYTSANAIQNALLTENPIQVLVLAFEAAFLSLLFVYYREQIWIYAQERFDAPPSPFPIPDRKSGKWYSSISEVAAIVLAIPLIAVVIRASEAEHWQAPEGILETFVKPLGMTKQGLALVALVGVVIAHLTALWIRDVGAEDLARFISRILGWFPARLRNRLGPGYFSPGDPPKFHEGHAKSILLGLVIFLLYVLSYFLSNPEFRVSASNPIAQDIFKFCELSITPASYVLGIAMFLLTLFCGITFFTDRYHIPLLTLLLVLTYVASRIQGMDSVFPIVLTQPTAASAVNAQGLLEQKAVGRTIQRPPYAKPAAVSDAYAARLNLISKGALPGAEKPDTIVVCASGGGIQAAAWTVQVLTGLDELTDGRFSKNVQLISATSGGSLGALYYLDSYNLRDGGNTFPGAGGLANPKYYENLYRVRRAAARSGLEGILWAFYQLDLPRSLGLSPLLPPLQDRGWAIEMNWRQQLKDLRAWRLEQTGIPELEDEALTLNSLSYFTAKGVIPAVILNSTIVETGRQTAFTTVTFPERAKDDPSVLQGDTFHELYRPIATSSLPEEKALSYVPDLDRTTAVRLSAAFPYISPVAHPFVAYGVDANGNRLSPKGLTVSSQHLTDGGFFDNLGILGCMEWIRTIVEKPDLRLRKGRIVILQILDRETTLRSRRGVAGSKDGWQMALFGPLETIFKVRGATQTSRTALELSLLRKLYADYMEVEFIEIGPRALKEQHTPPISWKLSSKDLDKLRESWLLHVYDNPQLKDLVERLKPSQSQP